MKDSRNDDRIARIVFGEDSYTGTARFLAFILTFIVVAGTFFWWIGR